MPHEKRLTPLSHTGPDGKDLDWKAKGFTDSRCTGICDEDLATCWCMEGKYAAVLPPVGSPAGTPFVKEGRPLSQCGFEKDKDGVASDFGYFKAPSYDSLYGPKGWCTADFPEWKCPCQLDGIYGELCDGRNEAFCVNQCSGNGDCYLGFCRCYEGWYGSDCSRLAKGFTNTSPGLAAKPWLKAVVAQPAAALDPPPASTRKRPLIYIYDMDTLYTTKILQWRVNGEYCVHRRFIADNSSTILDNWFYSIETLLHERLSVSEHRTYDPEEADFFFMPIYMACVIFPIDHYADYPWWGGPQGQRTKNPSMMSLEAKRWVQNTFPYWNRTGGRDHLVAFTHDEGACWAPTELWPAIMVVHWGRLDINHTSATAFPADNYTEEYTSYEMPGGWLQHIKGHPCYDPVKDIVVPSMKAPRHHMFSPLMGAEPRRRDILLFFRGDVGEHRWPWYSRGIRQKLHKLCKDGKWWDKHRIYIGSGHTGEGGPLHAPYPELLARSVFCLVSPGDGWSGRAEDAVLNGCIPVVVQDNVHPVFASILDWDSFSIRVAENDTERMPEILAAVSEERRRQMQQNLSKVWSRFQWGSLQVFKTHTVTLADEISRYNTAILRHRDRARDTALQEGRQPDNFDDLLPQKQVSSPHEAAEAMAQDDAFATLMQWLYGRIADTRA